MPDRQQGRRVGRRAALLQVGEKLDARDRKFRRQYAAAIRIADVQRFAVRSAVGGVGEAAHAVAGLDTKQRLAERGDDWRDLLRTYIDALNAVVAGAPAGMTLGVHVCRSQDASWQSDVSYEPIAKEMFGRIEVGVFFLEYDNPRAGGFEPLRLLPEGKRVVLGLMGSRDPNLETVEALRAKVDEASRYVPRERLSLSPHCGFATGLQNANTATQDLQARKLARAVEAAKAIWGSA